MTTAVVSACLDSSISWASYLRTCYPRMLFFLSNTQNQFAVIYSASDDGSNIECVYITLSKDAVLSSSRLPENIRQHLQPRPTTNGGYMLPGISDDRTWVVAGRSLQCGPEVLVHILVEVDKTTGTVGYCHMTSIEKTNGGKKRKKVVRMPCKPSAVECVERLMTVSGSMRTVVGM